MPNNLRRLPYTRLKPVTIIAILHCLVALIIYFFRNVFSSRNQSKLVCASSGMEIFVSITATVAAGDGISPSTVRSARPRRRLTVWCTWCMGMAPRRIYTVPVKLKECVRKSTKALCALDSGSVTVKVTDLLTRTRAGTQCPGSTWKKYHLHRPNLLHCHDCIAGSLNIKGRAYIAIYEQKGHIRWSRNIS